MLIFPFLCRSINCGDVGEDGDKDGLYLQINDVSSSEEDTTTSIERPNTLKFLAAREIFQENTVRAIKRLPYTPDPGMFWSLLSFDEGINEKRANLVYFVTKLVKILEKWGNE